MTTETSADAAPTKTPKSKTPLTDALTEPHQIFVREYMRTLNKTKAAQAAGYGLENIASARTQGCRLSMDDKISAAIREQLEVNAGAPSEWIVSEIAKIARASARDILSFGPGGVVLNDSTTIDDDVMDSIASAGSSDTKFGTTISIKFHDKNAALFKLAEIAGLTKGRVELTGKDGKDLIPGHEEGKPMFIRADVKSRDQWEEKMKAAQKDQRDRDNAAIEDAAKSKA